MERSAKMEISNLLTTDKTPQTPQAPQLPPAETAQQEITPQLPPPESVLREIMRTYKIKDENLAKAILAFGRKLKGNNTEYFKNAIQKVKNGTFFTKRDRKEFNRILNDYYISKPNIGPVEFAEHAIGILRKHDSVKQNQKRKNDGEDKKAARRKYDRERKRLQRAGNNGGSSSKRPRSHRGGSSPNRGGSSKRGRHN